MLDRLFPDRADNRFDGHRAALWLLGLLVALKPPGAAPVAGYVTYGVLALLALGLLLSLLPARAGQRAVPILGGA